ncbi:metallo-beta-lactamase protein, putative [Ichthyophthirius multifiliis]|uniref:Metallo-beta-lactamase protein, putative n=1 Tax=Ichthyophthirius multifiliis TaxID=5932 RepID=G0QMG6_ICHMU|nr:metallo-beta-lactamase protein, putative [Ichthyophthirius multifiliis]EGR33588.1 metallo-beta-lactamase protein, putative [Ichthyophthirius multifiliis]|eukprot:XP_004037574.1 metallo-beta-lactamase protein, putative [Ichthyophthirius multifiliis]
MNVQYNDQQSAGEAIIIDPLREPEPYLEIAQKRNTKIKYIFESHFHADFVSGHLSLQQKTGAQIVYGPNAEAKYSFKEAKDNEIISFGKCKIKILHTPGHTLESSCFLLLDSQDKPHSVYTGDTLFLGEVGRPDLAVQSGKITEYDLAGLLYDSLHQKILTLPDNVIIFPSHGAGSSCGKNILKGHSCSVGMQKKNNYALQEMKKEDFIKVVTSELHPPPQYFYYNAALNKQGYQDQNKKNELKVIKNAKEIEKIIKENQALILDCRDDISLGFLENSINIGLSTPFAVWVGTLIQHDISLILLTDKGKEQEAAQRLYRIGYEKIIGFIESGINCGLPIIPLKHLDTKQFVQKANNQSNFILDVRNKSETDAGMSKNAKNIPLPLLGKQLMELPKDQEIFVYCQSGARSKMAATILSLKGYHNVTICNQGFPDLKKDGLNI